MQSCEKPAKDETPRLKQNAQPKRLVLKFVLGLQRTPAWSKIDLATAISSAFIVEPGILRETEPEILFIRIRSVKDKSVYIILDDTHEFEAYRVCFKDLFVGECSEKSNFFTNIRKINNSYGFCSVSANRYEFSSNAPYCSNTVPDALWMS